MSVYLWIGFDVPVRVQCSIGVLNRDGNLMTSKTTDLIIDPNTGTGWSQFISREALFNKDNGLLENNTLTLAVDIEFTKINRVGLATSRKRKLAGIGEMITAAIKSLKERGGSSLQAIKKYLTAIYKVDCEILAPYIKEFLKNAVVDGKLIQVKGKGTSGSFKLPVVSKKEVAEKKVAKPKAKTAAKKPATSKAKKAKASPTKIKKPVAKKGGVEKKKVAKPNRNRSRYNY
jgi:hypothetical protein